MIDIVGDVWRDRCPICKAELEAGREVGCPIMQHWRIPFSKIDTITVAGGYCNMLPMLKADGAVYGFSICHVCSSIFLNPYDSGADTSYENAIYPEERIRDRSKMVGHENQYNNHLKTLLHRRPNGRLFDAGCGIGQYMFLAAEDPALEMEIFGVELTYPGVRSINAIAAERGLADRLKAIQGNLCTMSLTTPPLDSLGQFDTIILSETFEHLEHPAKVLAMLAAMLTPGGQLFYTAQAPDGGMLVRPSEPIYMSRRGQEILIDFVGLNVVSTVLEAGRWKTVLER